MTGLPEDLQAALADRYLLERELGRGGMATVFLAHDLRHDRPVALKVLHPELAATLGPERFQREIKLAARLQHPHILPVHDSGEAAGQLWFTMPSIEGESLRERLRRERQLPVDEALRITREAALALDYAHRHGILHRDIKPENILLSDGQALVADFGVARALSADQEQLTQTGFAVGTPAYMSPEQAAGDRELDTRTDVYALGAVLYEMLAGEPPFTGATAQAITAKRLKGEVPHVRQIRSAVPESVDQTIHKALALVPADRFNSAADFARALTAAHGSEPSTTTVTATPKRESRLKVPSAVVFVLGLLVTATMGLLLWQRSHRPGVPGGPAAQREARRVPGTSGSPLMEQPSVAVLPFTNLSDEPANEYFSDGVTEELITALSQVEGLRVAARASCFAFKGNHSMSRRSPRNSTWAQCSTAACAARASACGSRPSWWMHATGRGSGRIGTSASSRMSFRCRMSWPGPSWGRCGCR
jgi:serine/threonine protein kinase